MRGSTEIPVITSIRQKVSLFPPLKCNQIKPFADEIYVRFLLSWTLRTSTLCLPTKYFINKINFSFACSFHDLCLCPSVFWVNAKLIKKNLPQQASATAHLNVHSHPAEPGIPISFLFLSLFRVLITKTFAFYWWPDCSHVLKMEKNSVFLCFSRRQQEYDTKTCTRNKQTRRARQIDKQITSYQFRRLRLAANQTVNTKKASSPGLVRVKPRWWWRPNDCSPIHGFFFRGGSEIIRQDSRSAKKWFPLAEFLSVYFVDSHNWWWQMRWAWKPLGCSSSDFLAAGRKFSE